MYINKIQILGNITRSPEVKSLPNGTKVVAFSVATNEVYKDKNTGQKTEKVEYHNIVCFGNTADNIGKYMDKGSQIYIEGKMQTRSWDDKTTGEKKYRVEILANHVQFGNKPQGQGGKTQGDQKPEVQGQGMPDLDTIDYGDVNADISDIPF